MEESLYMNDKKKKKEYVIPEAEIVDFSGEDIVTASGLANWWGGGDNNTEHF